MLALPLTPSARGPSRGSQVSFLPEGRCTRVCVAHSLRSWTSGDGNIVVELQGHLSRGRCKTKDIGQPIQSEADSWCCYHNEPLAVSGRGISAAARNSLSSSSPAGHPQYSSRRRKAVSFTLSVLPFSKSNKAGGALTYTLAGTVPPWLIFNSSADMLYGVAPGDGDVSMDLQLVATDRDGELSSQTFLFFECVRLSGRASPSFSTAADKFQELFVRYSGNRKGRFSLLWTLRPQLGFHTTSRTHLPLEVHLNSVSSGPGLAFQQFQPEAQLCNGHPQIGRCH